MKPETIRAIDKVFDDANRRSRIAMDMLMVRSNLFRPFARVQAAWRVILRLLRIPFTEPWNKPAYHDD